LAPDTSSGKEVVRLEHERVIELERQLLAMRAAQTERDRHITQLVDHLVKKGALLEQAEANAVEAKLVQGELQARVDELLLSRDQALEQAQCELAQVHAKLEARESELAVVRLRLTDTEDGWAKNEPEANTSPAQTAAGLVNMDVDPVMHRVLERMRAMEIEISSLRGNDKSIESMECRNEG
jgi:chromosome segregation ATPase